uniref:Uncharacterized protein n=1 Tax=Tanacetum cinerariifolium TaxID=118510 RepID=A0A699GJ72_TANCI|nr:hypothetical protein [Tanacetum cinerariifolium]
MPMRARSLGKSGGLARTGRAADHHHVALGHAGGAVGEHLKLVIPFAEVVYRYHIFVTQGPLEGVGGYHVERRPRKLDSDLDHKDTASLVEYIAQYCAAAEVLQPATSKETLSQGSAEYAEEKPIDHLYPARAGARHYCWLHRQRQRRQPGRFRRDHVVADHGVPAPDQDDHRAAGVCHAGCRHCPHGRCKRSRPYRPENHGLVLPGVGDVAEPGPGAGQHLPPRRRAARPYVHRRVQHGHRGVQPVAQGFRYPPGAGVHRRRHGQERDPADRRVLAVLRLRGRRHRRQGQGHDRSAGRPGAHHAQGDRLCDVVCTDCRVRSRGRHHRQERPGRAVHVRRVHGRVLLRHLPAVVPADVCRFPVPEKPRVRPDARAARPGAAGLLHRVERSGVSENPGRPRAFRRAQPDCLVRAADRLLVQPRRFDDVLHLCHRVHRPGLRHRDDAGRADHHDGRADGHFERHCRRAARIAGGDCRHPEPVQHSRSGPAAAARYRPLPGHGAFGHQRGGQRRGRCGRGQVGGRAGQPRRRGNDQASCAIGRQQRVVRAALHDAAMVEHQDLLGVGHRGQAVRDHQRRAAFRDFLQLRLDRLLRFRVERRRGLVEDQDRRILEQGAGNRHALLFAARQFQSPLADHGVVTVGQALDEIVDRRRACDRHDVVMRGARFAVGDVVRDGVVEQHPEQQPRHGRLARTAVSHHGRGGAGRDGEVDIEQDLPLGVVAEIDVVEAHFRALGHQGLGILGVGDLAVLVQQREQLFHVGQALLDLAVDHAQEVQGDIQLDHEGVHQHQVAQRHGAGDHAHGGAPQDQRDGRGDDQRLPRVQYRQRRLRLHRRRFVMLQAFVVALRFVVLVAEVLDGLIVDQRVDGAGIGLRIEFVHGAAKVRAPVGDRDREHDVRHQRDEGNHREPDIVMQHQVTQHQRDFHQRGQDVEQRVGNQRAHRARAAFDIARHAAGLAIEVEAQRQGVQVTEHLQRNGAHGALRHARKQELAQLGEHGRRQPQQAIRHQRRHRQHQQRLRVLRRDGERVDQPLHHDGHAHVGQLGAHQAAQRQQHAPLVHPQRFHDDHPRKSPPCHYHHQPGTARWENAGTAHDALPVRRQCVRRRVRRLDHGAGRYRRFAAGHAPRQRPRGHHCRQLVRVQEPRVRGRPAVVLCRYCQGWQYVHHRQRRGVRRTQSPAGRHGQGDGGRAHVRGHRFRPQAAQGAAHRNAAARVTRRIQVRQRRRQFRRQPRRRARRGSRQRRPGRVSVQPGRGLRLAAARCGGDLDPHSLRPAERRRHAGIGPARALGDGGRRGLFPHRGQGHGQRHAGPGPQRARGRHWADARALVFLSVYPGRRRQSRGPHPHRTGGQRHARPVKAGRGLVPALGIRHLCRAPPHCGRCARPGGLPGRLHLRVGAVPAAAPQARRTGLRELYAGGLPQPLRPVQERPAPARGPPGRAVDPGRLRQHAHLPALRLGAAGALPRAGRPPVPRLARVSAQGTRRIELRGPPRLPGAGRPAAYHAGRHPGPLAGAGIVVVAGALEHPGPANADGAEQPAAVQAGRRRADLDRWLGWLSAGAPAPAGHAAHERRRQPGGAVGRCAQFFRGRDQPPSHARPGTQQRGAGQRVLRHVDHVAVTAAAAHRRVCGDQSRHQVRQERPARLHADRRHAGNDHCPLPGTERRAGRGQRNRHGGEFRGQQWSGGGGEGCRLLIAQLPPQNLAHIRLRQLVAELDVLRLFIRRQLVLAEVEQLLGRQIRILAHHEQLDGLARILVRHADARHFQHARVAGHHALHLVRIHVETGDDDHVFLAVDNLGVAARVHDADVARLEEAVGRHGLGRFVRTVPVAGHHLRAADGDLAGLAQRHRVAVVVEDFHFGRRNRQADGTRKFLDVHAVGRGHGRGFGQTVTFDDRRAGHLEPLVRHGLLHGHAAAVAHRIAGEVELGKIGIVEQRVVQGIDRRQHRHPVLAQLLDETGNVARIRNQQRQPAHAHAHERAHGQRVDVVQRQRRHEHQLLARVLELQPGLVLQHVGDDIPVQQHRALRHARGAARVLQEGDVIVSLLDRLQRQAGRFRHHFLVRDRARQRVRRHHLLDLAHHQIDDRAFDQAQHVAHGGHHHVLDAGIGQHLLQGDGKIFQHDDRFRAGIDQLVLQLAGRVQRVDVDHRVTGAQHGRHRHRVLQHVRHHDGHARARRQATALQPGRHPVRQLVQFAVSEEFIHADESVAVGVLAESFFQQVRDRAELRAVDLGRYAFRHASQYLADIRFGQFIAEFYVLRLFIASQMLLAVRHQGLGRQAGVLAHHENLDRLARMVVRHAHARAFAHARVRRHHALDFVRIHVEAGDQDHVLLAVDNLHVAAFVHDADVARLEVAVAGHDLGGFVRTVPVAGHHLRAADGDFAGLAQRHFVAVVVEDGDVGRGHRQADGAGKGLGVAAVAGGHGRRFGQSITFDDRRAGHLAPAVGHHLLHGHAAAKTHFKRGEIEVERAAADTPHGAHGQRKDVIQRQRRHDDRLFRDAAHGRFGPLLDLQHVGNDVLVREHGALGHARGAARVLQESGVGQRAGDGREFHPRAMRQRGLEAHRVGQRIRRHHALDIAHDKVDQHALGQPQHFAHAADNDVLDLGAAQHLLERVGKVFQEDDGAAAGVVELMLELARRVQRVDIDDRVASAQDGGNGDRILQHVGHHDAHARTFFHAPALQPGAQAPGIAAPGNHTVQCPPPPACRADRSSTRFFPCLCLLSHYRCGPAHSAGYRALCRLRTLSEPADNGMLAHAARRHLRMLVRRGTDHGRAGQLIQPLLALIEIKRRYFLHRTIKSHERSLLLEQAPEGRQIIMIGAHRAQVRIGQRFGKPAVVAGVAAPAFLEAQIVRFQVGKDAGLFGAAVAHAGFAGVVFSEHVAVTHQQRQEIRAAGVVAGIGFAHLVGAVQLQPALYPGLFHGRGKAFVELGVALHIDHLVRQLVEHHARQLGVGIIDEGRQQRIAEPAQRGVRGHAAHLHVVAFGAQLVGVGVGVVLAVVTTVADAAGNRKTPLDRTQRQLGRGHDIPQHERARQRSVILVAGVVRQAQFLYRKAADQQRFFEPRLELGIGIGVAQPVIDGPRIRPQRVLALRSLHVILELRAARQHGHGAGRRQPVPAAISQAMAGANDLADKVAHTLPSSTNPFNLYECIPDHQPRARLVGHARTGDERAAIVENPNHFPMGDATRGAVCGVDIKVRFALGRPQTLDVYKTRIEEIAGRWRNHRQRIALCKLRVAGNRFIRRDKRGQGIEAIGRHRCRIKLALARRRGKAALRKRRVGHVEFLPAFDFQRLPVEMHGPHVLGVERLRGQLVVGLGKARMIEAHGARQQAEDLRVGLGFAQRRDGRVIGHHVQVAERQVGVHVLELGGGRQHDVRIVHRVGLEVLEHHREQVVAAEARLYLAGIGGDRQRVRVVDNHGLHLRAELRRGRPQQVVADGGHVDGARQFFLQVRALQRRLAGDIAHRHAAAAHALHAIVDADRHRRAGLGHLAVQPRQFDNFFGGDAAGGGRARGRPLGCPLFQLLEAQRVVGDVGVVEQVFGNQHVHQAQRQGGIGTGQQRDVLVAFLGRERAVRVNRDQRGAVALGLLGAGPEMQVGGDGIAAPDDDQLGILELFHVGADRAADRVPVAGGAGRGAHGAVQQRRTELVEEPRRHRLALHQPHGAAIAVRQDGFGIARGNRFQAVGNRAQRLVPADALELAFALGAHAAQRIQQAFVVVGALGVARDLGAQHASRGGMVGVAFDGSGHAIFHRDQDGAGIGAVVRARCAHLCGCHVWIRKQVLKAVW